MKNIFLISLMILCVLFASCTKKGEEITGDKLEDIENITQKDKEDTTNLPLQSDENDDILPKTDALSEIQKISGTLRFVESENDEIVNNFVLALKNKDTKALSEFCGGESEYFDFINDANILEYVILPFEIAEKDRDQNKGDYISYASHYAVNLKYESKTDNLLFDKGAGEKLFYLQAGLYNPICAFVPFEEVLDSIYVKQENDETLIFCDMFLSSITCAKLENGKNDACGFDLTNDVHFVTHLMASLTQELPPYSFNQVNTFLAETFDGNKGISVQNIPDWASTRAYELDIDFSDESVYSNFDKKMLGCSYAHGGNVVMYRVISDQTNSDDREITILCYSDFAKITKSKKLTFYFDESGEYPKLLGVEQKSFNDNKIASMGF